MGLMEHLLTPEIGDRSSQHILVCQNRTCRKQGSAKVLAAFIDEVTGKTRTGETPVLRVEGSSCLGRCGSGPMVVVLPEEVWYGGVGAKEVPAIVERHRDRVST